MIAVIFEAWPAQGQRQHYLALAAELRTELDGLDGFVSIERFESLTEPGKMLSLSFWRDEHAVTRWRNTASHRRTQRLGFSTVFADYRLRVAAVSRDYGMSQRQQVPQDSARQWADGDGGDGGDGFAEAGTGSARAPGTTDIASTHAPSRRGEHAMASDRTSRPESEDAPEEVPGAQHDDAEDVPGSQHGDTAQDDADDAVRGGTGAQPELPESTDD